MFVNFTFQVDGIAFNDPSELSKPAEQVIGELFHKNFAGMHDYKESDVLVNFDKGGETQNGEETAPSATLFVDLTHCTEPAQVIQKAQLSIIDFLNRAIPPIMGEIRDDDYAGFPHILPVDPTASDS